jgi:hypothetical protein
MKLVKKTLATKVDWSTVGTTVDKNIRNVSFGYSYELLYAPFAAH